MSKANRGFALRVTCCAGFQEEKLPCRFFLHSREIKVIEIVDRWLAPDHRYFKVRADDGAIYILRHEVASGLWELTMFDLNR